MNARMGADALYFSLSLSPEGMAWAATTATAVFFPLQHCIPYDGDGDAAAVFWFAFPRGRGSVLRDQEAQLDKYIYRHAL